MDICQDIFKNSIIIMIIIIDKDGNVWYSETTKEI